MVASSQLFFCGADAVVIRYYLAELFWDNATGSLRTPQGFSTWSGLVWSGLVNFDYYLLVKVVRLANLETPLPETRAARGHCPAAAGTTVRTTFLRNRPEAPRARRECKVESWQQNEESRRRKRRMGRLTRLATFQCKQCLQAWARRCRQCPSQSHRATELVSSELIRHDKDGSRDPSCWLLVADASFLRDSLVPSSWQRRQEPQGQRGTWMRQHKYSVHTCNTCNTYIHADGSRGGRAARDKGAFDVLLFMFAPDSTPPQ